ncbi:unnamed protein product [Closterium sp. NIES-65]|nr:unnamed protein product [Closterium sp. NIES-65]
MASLSLTWYSEPSPRPRTHLWQALPTNPPLHHPPLLSPSRSPPTLSPPFSSTSFLSSSAAAGADCVFEVVTPPHLSSSSLPSPQLLNCELPHNSPSSSCFSLHRPSSRLPRRYPSSSSFSPQRRSSRLIRHYPSSSSFSPQRRSSKLLPHYSSSSCFSPQRLSSRLLRPYPSSPCFLPSAAQQQTASPLFLRLLYLSPHLLCSCLLLLMATSLALPSLPLLVLQLAPDGSGVNFPSWLNCLERMLSGTLVSGFNLWFVTQQSGSGAIPKPASTPTSTSSDPYADGLRAAIAETERIAATAQTTAAAAPDNAAARDLACVLSKSLESTRKRLTEHLATPSPRSAPMPSDFAPSHSDLLADWHIANARASQVILACLPPTLLPQCSHIRYAKDLLCYLTERFQSQNPINVIALLASNTGRHPNWLQLSRQRRHSSAQAVLVAADSGASAQM